MKQQKLSGYTPNYPKKLLKGAVLTTAAMMALGASAGCRLIRGELTTSGAVAIDEPEPTEVLVLDGEVAIDEPTDEVELEGYMMPEDTPDPDGELMLSGDVAIAPEEP